MVVVVVVMVVMMMMMTMIMMMTTTTATTITCDMGDFASAKIAINSACTPLRRTCDNRVI